MTIATKTDWEIRTAGAATNGAGFKDLNPGTSVDYGQQDAAELALSDIATDGAGTGVSSATGGFTAAMEGNCIFLAGSGFTTGWYQIVGYTDTNNITIDRSAGASATGGTGNVGGAYKFDSTFNNTFFSATNKGTYNTCHIKAGTYTGFGTAANTMARTYMRFRGFNTARGDDPTGTNRPLLDTGDNASYIYWSGAYGRMEHVRIDSTYSSGTTNSFYASGMPFVMRGCKVTRSGYANAFAARFGGDWAKMLQSEFICTNGTALQSAGGEGMIASYCYIHDSKDGCTYSSSGSTGMKIFNCIFDTCTGYAIMTHYGSAVVNTTIYDCGTGILFNSSHNMIINTIIHTCATGLNANQETFDDNNCVYNCGTPRTGGVEAGPNSITSDPLLVDPANQDFTLDATSPAFNTAIKLGAAVGLP